MEINEIQEEVVQNALNNANTENQVDLNLIDDLGGMDLFSDEFGGDKSGVDELVLEKFKAGMNENVLLTNIAFKREDTWAMCEMTFQNEDGLEQPFSIFAPVPRPIKDAKPGEQQTSWGPLLMQDAQGRPLRNEEWSRSVKGGVPLLDEKGRKQRTAQRKVMYRNETESEAKVRQVTRFRNILNSIIAVFCKEDMKGAWGHFVAQNNGQSPANWGEYVDRIVTTLNEYTPKCTDGKQWHETPLRLKLYRKYDPSTSNKRSEKFLELPKSIHKGLYMEKMCANPEDHKIFLDNYELENMVAAPKAQNTQAGLNNASSGLPTNGIPGMMPSNGLPSGMPTLGMPGLPK